MLLRLESSTLSTFAFSRRVRHPGLDVNLNPSVGLKEMRVEILRKGNNLSQELGINMPTNKEKGQVRAEEHFRAWYKRKRLISMVTF